MGPEIVHRFRYEAISASTCFRWPMNWVLVVLNYLSCQRVTCFALFLSNQWRNLYLIKVQKAATTVKRLALKRWNKAMRRHHRSRIPQLSTKKKQPSLTALSFFQCMSHNEAIIWSLVHNLLVCSFEFGALQYLFRLNTISKAIFGIFISNLSLFIILGTSQHCQWRSLGFMVYLVWYFLLSARSCV